MDLFIGARTIPWKYGIKAISYILENNGEGEFTEVTQEKAPELMDFGFVKDAKWVHLNDPDYLIWSLRQNGPQLQFSGTTAAPWNLIFGRNRITKYTWLVEFHCSGDFDENGKMDFIAGNLGLNSKLKASLEEPLRMYVSDLIKTVHKNKFFPIT
ncbi:MAG: hypothetical protein WD426_11065 [Anditalea sp.]